MTLLTPAALAFAALLAIPIIVHLFKPRRVRRMPFSSLRWLAHSPQKLSRRIQWHQLLLFAMRAGFLLLLVLALARPLWTRGDARTVSERVIVLDVSRSMALRVGDRPTPIERARQIAAELVESAPPGTRTTVLLAGSTARRLGSPDRDASALLPELRRVEATTEDTNLATALALAQPLLSRPGHLGELVFLTDNQQGAWDADALTAFAKTVPAQTRIKIVDLGVGTAANGWIADARIVEVGDSGRHLLRIELAASGNETQDRTLQVAGIPGEPQAVRAVTLDPERLTVLHLELPADAELKGQTAKVTLSPPDALPDDDEFFVCLDARSSLRVLLVAPEAVGPAAIQPGFALRTAVKSLTDSGIRSARLVLRSPTAVSAADLNEADIVLLADVPELPESATTALDERVRSGMGLGVFLGPRVRADWFSQNLFRPLQPTEGLLPVAVAGMVDAGERAPWQLPARPSALLAGLSDPLLGDLAEITSRRYHRLDGELPASASVAARFADGTPILVEHRVGAGTVLLVNASPDDSLSSLPQSKVFVPFVDRMLGYLGRGRGRAFTTGQPVSLPLEGIRSDETATVVGPGDERRSVAAGQNALDLGDIGRAGAYRIEARNASTFVFVVNAGRGDSALAPTDHALLRSWWQPLECSLESPAESHADRQAHTPFPFWPVLIAAAALLLVLETLTAAWLCPRLAPAPTISLIQRQRLHADRSS